MDEIARIQARLTDFLAEIADKRAVVELVVRASEIHIYARPDGFGIDKPFFFGRGDTVDACLDDAIRQFREMRASLNADDTKANSSAEEFA